MAEVKVLKVEPVEESSRSDEDEVLVKDEVKSESESETD